MISFLSGFLGNLSATQSKQIVRVLSQQKDKGEIRTYEEFQGKLLELAKLVQSGKLTQQTPSFFMREGELMESDAFRTFFDLARLDNEALLQQIEHLGNVLRAHRKILAENYFSAIDSAIDELNAEVTAYEILENQKYSGHSTVVRSWDFSVMGGVPSESHLSPAFISLREDLRGGESLLYSAPVEGEEGFHLAVRRENSERRLFNDVTFLTDSTTPQTSFNSSTSYNSPFNAIDGDPDSGWEYAILVSDYVDPCRLKISLNFSGARRINSIALKGLPRVPVTLYSVSYVDSGGQAHTLNLGSSQTVSHSGLLGSIHLPRLSWIISHRKRIFPVGNITARSLILTFQQATGTEGEYFFNEEIEDWQEEISLETADRFLSREVGLATASLPPELNLSSGGTSVHSSLGLPGLFAPAPPAASAPSVGERRREERTRARPSSSSVETIDPIYLRLREMRRARFIKYSFGLSDAYALESEFYSNGFFIPESISMSRPPDVLTFYLDAEYPSGENTSFELLMRKENFGSTGILLDIETIPILPYGTSSINERLFFTRREDSTVIHDVGKLQFYPDLSESFSVYRGSTELTLGSDYYISADDGETWETSVSVTEGSFFPKTLLVKVLDPRTDMKFHVEYTPLLSTGEIGEDVWLNSQRTVRLGRNRRYIFENERESGTVSQCVLTMRIVARANTLNTRVSPYLKHLVILGG